VDDVAHEDLLGHEGDRYGTYGHEGLVETADSSEQGEDVTDLPLYLVVLFVKSDVHGTHMP
jgi:hypothetical protein